MNLLKESVLSLFESHTPNQIKAKQIIKNNYESTDQKMSFDEYLRSIRSGIKIDRNKTSVKLFSHVDLDGMVSSTLMVNKLVQMGIPKDRITIKFAQYGYDESDLVNAGSTQKRHEMTMGTDFSAFPRVDVFKVMNQMMSFQADPYKCVLFINKKDWSTVSEKEFKDEVMKDMKPEESKWLDGNISTLYSTLRIYSKYKSSSKGNGYEEWMEPFNARNVKVHPKVPTARPDFILDHHDNSGNKLTKGLSGAIAIEAPSNAGFIAKKYCPGMMDDSDIAAVNMADSAGYTKEELENSVFLDKHFTGKDKKRNLATIMATMVEQLVKKNPEAAKWVIKNSTTNLSSIYNNLLKANKFNDSEMALYKALSQNDIEGAKKIADTLPKSMTKNYQVNKDQYKKIVPSMSRESWAKKNAEDLEIAKSGHASEKDKEEIEALKAKKKELGRKASPEKDEVNTKIDSLSSKKGRCYAYKDFMIQDDTVAKGYPTRYQPSLMAVNGERKPYTLKMFGDMIQVAANPLYKGEVDFAKVLEAAFPEFEKWLNEQDINSYTKREVMEEMRDKSGGHKTILTVQGFNKITPTSKEGKGDFYKYKDMLNRANKLNLDLPKMKEHFDQLDSGVMEKFRKIRSEAEKKMVSIIIGTTERMYPVDQSKFNGKADEKWNIKQ